MPLLDELERPTLLVNPVIAQQNIAFMAEKARRQGIRFRPHFKTHQSAAVGEWFRQWGLPPSPSPRWIWRCTLPIRLGRYHHRLFGQYPPDARH